jgi:predicted NUDIX family NTP pyrophosphohydrolase
VANVKSERSAGGVIYQERAGDMWVALIATRGKSIWGLPKGQIEYWYRDSKSHVLCHKRVQYYLLKYVNGDVNQHGWEVDDARWFPIDEALDTASYENEREVLSRAREHWNSIPAHGG